jgi:ABC-2 type transport system ATP-binding protein
LADRITIIRLGRRVETGTLDELRHLTRTSMTVTTAQPPVGVAGMAGVHDLTVDGHTARFEVEPDAMTQVQRRLADHGVTTMIASPPSLQQLFLRHYGQHLTEAELVESGS